jgi:hypothetical protein
MLLVVAELTEDDRGFSRFFTSPQIVVVVFLAAGALLAIAEMIDFGRAVFYGDNWPLC